jgi:predicted nucleic acid-binding protein
VKAFVLEDGTEEVRGLLAAEAPGATSRISYVECSAAFARGWRERRLSQRRFAALRAALDEGWRDLVIVELDEELAGLAGRLTRSHPLRAGDAIHLASALSLAADDPAALTLATWDQRLWHAARAMGFSVFPAAPPP